MIVEQTIPFLSNHELGWANYRQRHPRVWQEIVRIYQKANDRGEKRLGMKLAFELVRSFAPREAGSPVALNNNWTASAARDLATEYPSLAHLIRTRRTAA